MTDVNSVTFISHLSGGGSFFLACEDLGIMFDNSFSACASLSLSLSLSLKVEIRSHTLSPLFRWLSKLRRLWPSVP